jgi:Domain of unknown function (DUF1707)
VSEQPATLQRLLDVSGRVLEPAYGFDPRTSVVGLTSAAHPPPALRTAAEPSAFEGGAHPGLTFFDEAGRARRITPGRSVPTDPHPHLVPATSPRTGPDKPGPDFVQDQPSTATLDVAAPPASPIRASYFEREESVGRPHQALSEGRLDLAATEVSIAAAYAATYRHELASLMADLPDTALISPGIPSTLPTWHGGTATGIPPALHALLRTPARCLTHPSRARRSDTGVHRLHHPIWPKIRKQGRRSARTLLASKSLPRT